MEVDLKTTHVGYESVIEFIEKIIREPRAKSFALQVANDLQSQNIEVVANKSWINAVFPDGCTAFWLACPGKSPTEHWATYGLIDLNEAGGTIPSRADCVGDTQGVLELIAFLVSVFERRDWHSDTNGGKAAES
jgi:hypothetical protein